TAAVQLVALDKPENVEAAIHWLKHEAPIAEEHSNEGGNNTLYWVAAYVTHELAIGEDTAFRLLIEHYNPRCKPPWTEGNWDNFVKTFYSAAKGGKHDIGSKTREGLFGEAPRLPETPPQALPAPDDAGEEKPAKFPLIRYGDIKPVLTGQWLIKKLLPARGLCVVYGPPGCGKSFLTLHAVLHVASGKDYAALKTRQARVVYVAAEGQGAFRKRVRAAGDALGLDETTLQFDLVEVVPNLGG